MLTTSINLLGSFFVFTYFFLLLNQIKERTEKIKYIIASFLYWSFLYVYVLLFPERNSIANILINIGSYLFFMRIIAGRNFFCSFWEMIYCIILNILSQVIVMIIYLIPFKVLIDEFNYHDVLGNVLLVLTMLFCNGLLFHFVGRRLFKIRDTIWKRYSNAISNISYYLIILVIFVVLLGDIYKITLSGQALLISQRARISFFATITLLGLIGVFLVFRLLFQRKEAIELNELASRDELTGVLNRRFGLQHLKDQIRKSKELVISYIDINDLKKVNDSYGHEMGDRLICYIVSHIKEQIEPKHRMVRMGGDEFLLIFQDADRSMVEELLAGSLKNIDETKPEVLNQIRVSFSYGIAEFREGDSLEELLQNADKAMYQNKALYKQQSAYKAESWIKGDITLAITNK